MRILLSSENFDGFGGTESSSLTVTQELERLGRRAWIYAPRGGAIAEHAARVMLLVRAVRSADRFVMR